MFLSLIHISEAPVSGSVAGNYVEAGDDNSSSSSVTPAPTPTPTPTPAPTPAPEAPDEDQDETEEEGGEAEEVTAMGLIERAEDLIARFAELKF